jgi:3-hydroxyisobutyrate dehydrogenase-like beta-hydroxyacid dehydrogenase
MSSINPKTYEPTSPVSVAFLGLGVMGYPMARHLASKGHTVTVYNRTFAKAEKWVADHGGSAARTPREAAAGQETREGQVLRLLSAHWNATQRTPTALELLHWARARGEVLFDVNSIRPRITKLVDLGLVEASPTKRRCAVSGKRVCTWRVREAGGR